MTALKAGPGNPLDARKFRHPDLTADGQPRAAVALSGLKTLWFNTGTLCNLSCANCYIESSPTNDRLVYLNLDEVVTFLDEIEQSGLPTTEIGFTGGEPFMNPHFCAMLDAVLQRDLQALVLTNAMRPMMKCAEPLLALRQRYGERLLIRVSLDHYTPDLHELVRGENSWQSTIDGLKWLSDNGFRVHAASRTCWYEPEEHTRAGFKDLFAREGVRVDADDAVDLLLLPEMDETLDVPEITEHCWEQLGISPQSMMCASSRMVVKRKGSVRPVVAPCTLLPYDESFEMGHTLADAAAAVKLNHPHCARFCALGGGSCSRSAA